MPSNNYNDAQELWKSFRKEVMYNHRYFPAHPFLDKLLEIAKECELKISPGAEYYRARIIDDNAWQDHMLTKCFGPNTTEEDHKWYRNKANKFRGLSKEGSYVPQDPMLVKDGRSNPKYVSYLYISESPTTAVFEVRPLIYSRVNVAGIVTKEQLRIANIAVDVDLDPAPFTTPKLAERSWKNSEL